MKIKLIPGKSLKRGAGLLLLLFMMMGVQSYAQQGFVVSGSVVEMANNTPLRESWTVSFFARQSNKCQPMM